MSKIGNCFLVLEILKDELSACFKRGNIKVPIALGIHESVIKHYQNDDRFDADTIKRAIAAYCRGTKYLSNMAAGIPRIDIHGNSTGKVTKEEQMHAQKILANRKVY